MYCHLHLAVISVKQTLTKIMRGNMSMKKTTAKIITISDLVQWHTKGEIELSPKYQRNNVWNEKAKAYLLDTIVRGLPIPPIFLRQTVDINTKSTNREIIDGQQRVRAIIDFVVAEDFAIKKSHNKELGGKKYSELDDDIQEAILEYEILAEVVTEKDESIVYDMFARLNSNNMVLNKQEIRNSKYWGEFKVLIYRLSSKYRDFFLSNQLLTDNDCSRMRDSELINSMVIVLVDGIVKETPSSIETIYKKYDKSFPDSELIEAKFSEIMNIIEHIYFYFNGASGCFGNKNYFFTLYCVIANQMFGINGISLPRNDLFSIKEINNNFGILENAIAQFINDFETNIADKDNNYGLHTEYLEFAKYHSIRTTGKTERIKRVTFLNSVLERAVENGDE